MSGQKWPNGDEFAYAFTLPTKLAGDTAKATIESIVAYTNGLDEALRMLRTRERASTSEIAALLKVDPNNDSRSVKDSEMQGCFFVAQLAVAIVAGNGMASSTPTVINSAEPLKRISN